MMPDKPKLTLETALAEFPKECYGVLRDAGWALCSFEAPGPCVGDSHWVEKWRKLVCVSHSKWKEATTDNLLAAALRWLAGRPLWTFCRGCPWKWKGAETVQDAYKEGYARFADDPLRALLEEVSWQMRHKKED